MKHKELRSAIIPPLHQTSSWCGVAHGQFYPSTITMNYFLIQRNV